MNAILLAFLFVLFLFIGVPVKLGAGGVEEIIEITLTEEETAGLMKSAAAVQGLKDDLKKLM